MYIYIASLLTEYNTLVYYVEAYAIFSPETN